MFVFFSIFGGGNFLSLGGVSSWLNVASEIGIVALAVSLLMIAGELDVSVGSMLAASSMTVTIICGYWGAPIIVGILAAFALGLGVGVLNGILVTRTRVPSLIVTLATSFSVSGLTLGVSIVITGTVSLALTPDPISKALLGTHIGGMFQVTIIWWIAIALVIGWVLHVSQVGNWIYAVGGDKESARAAGVPTDGLKIALYVGSAFSATFVGISQVILYNSAQVAAGQSFVFNSIIAVVIGGVLLTGGYGSVVGVMLGVLTLSIVTQGIYYTKFDANWASLILGVLLLAAVVMNNTFRRMALTYRPRRPNIARP